MLTVYRIDSWGVSSLSKINELDKDIQLWATEMIVYVPFAITIPAWGGKRPPEFQNLLFKKGWSNADGFNMESNHQSGNAIDITPYSSTATEEIIGDKSYQVNSDYTAKGRLGIIGVIGIAVWNKLKSEGKISKDQYLHWGGFWKSKGDIGWDAAHFEKKLHPQQINL